MAISEIAHHFVGLFRHERLVLALLQRVVDSFADTIGVGKYHGALLHKDIRCVRMTILSSRRENGLKERFVRLQDISVTLERTG